MDAKMKRFVNVDKETPFISGLFSVLTASSEIQTMFFRALASVPKKPSLGTDEEQSRLQIFLIPEI